MSVILLKINFNGGFGNKYLFSMIQVCFDYLIRYSSDTKMCCLCKQCRPRLDATENKGMKLIWGNRNHDNLENTFRTMRPVRPVNTKINLRISLRCLYELLWPLCFSRSFSDCMLFLIKANIGVFFRCLSPSS